MTNKIHIADGQTDKLVGHIHFDYLLENNHERNKQNNMEIFNFTTFANQSYSKHLSKRNRIIIPGEDGELRELTIFEARVNRIAKQVEVYTMASYLDLKKSKVIKPHKTTAVSAERHAQLALAGTEIKVGDVAFNGVRTLEFESYTNPFDYLKRIASEFDLELDFRVEIENGMLTRYADLVERVGAWRGRIVELGRDLLELRRIEKTDNIVTALHVIGPEREDGTRLEVFVEDKEALQRWGRNGQHLVDVYEPMSTDQDMTESRLIQLGQAELAKRINTSVSYIGGLADLENIEGMENKKIRFGDTIRIKDTSYDPSLYLEAGVYKQSRDIKVKGQKRIELGDYIEYTEDEVKAIWKSLQAEIQRKAKLALQKAQVAQDTADEKNTVLFSASEPPTTERKVADVWFDTDNDNQMYRYDGSGWVASQFGENAIVADSITANHIKSLLGLNVNDQFIVDSNGNVKFAGTLEGASGTFEGAVQSGTSDKFAVIDNGLFQSFRANDKIRGYAAKLEAGSLIFGTMLAGVFTPIAEFNTNELNVDGVFNINADELRLGSNGIIAFDGAGSIDNAGGSMRWRQSVINYIMQNTAGSVFLYANGLKHTFGADGNYTLQGNKILFGSGPSLDMEGGSVRLRQSSNNYITMNTAGSVVFYANGAQSHAFWADGTKSGGTIMVDGKNLGMSPIDSPQILIEYIEFDVPLSPDGVKIYLDETYLKTVEKFAAFPNNGQVIEKGTDYIIIAGEGTADIRFAGERVNYTGAFFADMDEEVTTANE